MKILLLLFGVLFTILFVNAEDDTSYKCLKNVIEKMGNSSCPLITPEIERNIDDYARLYTACTKGHYLIHGCNESEWVHACTRRVANIPNSASSDQLRGFYDAGPMWKYCNKGVKDPDFECLKAVAATMNNKSCPEATKESFKKFGLKKLSSLTMSCFKTLYINHGCNEDQWIRVCNRQMDRLNVAANGGQEVVDMWRSGCTENPAYDCFEKVAEKMNDDSCPEVIYSKTQIETEEEIMRHQTACYKRFYLNSKCDIAEWKKVCKLLSFTFKPEDDGKSELMRKFCVN